MRFMGANSIEELRERLGDIRDTSPEALAWANQRARELRGTDLQGLPEALEEGERLFPESKWVSAILYLALTGGKDFTLPPPAGETAP